MVGIQGIGGVPEPKPERPANVRNSKQSPSAEGASSDGVVISSEAQAAAVVAKSIQVTQGQIDIRTERVEAAKEAIERGDFKKPEIVEVVAGRVSKFL
ncbi:MAG: flagellar biosynthesis anti-sigma factor FlgM [Candidatus Hydrogenedentes bacterium]|nr:flagellar biosynthesis anti-sigma factor FlgM [Candidatus Hydrogenedentota bacterium]